MHDLSSVLTLQVHKFYLNFANSQGFDQLPKAGGLGAKPLKAFVANLPALGDFCNFSKKKK